MSITQIYPKYIFLEDEQDINCTKDFFEKNNTECPPLDIGTWIKLEKPLNVYVVRPLDTFASISKRFNIDEEVLRQKVKTNSLFIGQKIELE